MFDIAVLFVCLCVQAMLAEFTGHDDAMDLYRHSTQLGIHEEGCIGYASMVCSTLVNSNNKHDQHYLYNIKNMKAVSVASDVMTWYTDRHPDNPCAYNMLGLLLERQKLLTKSRDVLDTCVQLLLSVSSGEGDDDDVRQRLDSVRCNYGRVLSQLDMNQSAVEQYKNIKKANFANQCGLADVYFRSRMYEDAYNTYQSTLEWLAPDDWHKSVILVAMAAVVYMFQGQDDAKLLLMQA